MFNVLNIVEEKINKLCFLCQIFQTFNGWICYCFWQVWMYLNGLRCHPTIFPEHDLLLFVKCLAANIYSHSRRPGLALVSLLTVLTVKPTKLWTIIRMLFQSIIKDLCNMSYFVWETVWSPDDPVLFVTKTFNCFLVRK